MLPDRVSNPGPLTYESGALPIALRGPASVYVHQYNIVRMMKTCKSLIKMTFHFWNSLVLVVHSVFLSFIL